MKLIDLLVQELPKRGGWPKGVGCIEMHSDGDIFFDGDRASDDFSLPQCSDGWSGRLHARYSNEVTQQQYESALAASKQVAWDGKSLPPAGVKCEYMVRQAANKLWQTCTIIAAGKENLIAEVNDEEVVFYVPQIEFRPMRTEAERKMQESINQLTQLVSSHMSTEDRSLAVKVYDAIAAGKVPGIKLAD